MTKPGTFQLPVNPNEIELAQQIKKKIKVYKAVHETPSLIQALAEMISNAEEK